MSLKTKCIITGASACFGPSVLAMIGSLDANWPGHPPVHVFDLGLDQTTLSKLASHNIPVIKVPDFCPWWREHYTWKIWAFNQAPADQFLWIDAGVVVLQPMDEVFFSIDKLGYFVVGNRFTLKENVSEACCAGCGVSADFRDNKIMVSANFYGLDLTSLGGQVASQALRVATADESYIKATQPLHRHDAAILSVIMHKTCAPVFHVDPEVYGGWKSPKQVRGQKVWIHRRKLSNQDMQTFHERIGQPAKAHMPTVPEPIKANGLKTRYWQLLNRYKLWKARKNGYVFINDGMRDVSGVEKAKQFVSQTTKKAA
jgi:hypothetical protein